MYLRYTSLTGSTDRVRKGGVANPSFVTEATGSITYST